MSKENETCCDAFQKMVPQFKWFSTIDQEPKLYLMPCIVANNDFLRVNHCPSCGTEVRNIQITEKRMMAICTSLSETNK